MQLLIAFVGGVTGGVFVLLGAWFSDFRGRQRALHDRLRELASVVLSCTRMMQDCVLEARVRLAQGPSVERQLAQHGSATPVAVKLDTARLSAYELEWHRAIVELRWLAVSTQIAACVQTLMIAVTALMGNWSASSAEWTQVNHVVGAAREALAGEMGTFQRMSARARRRYLRGQRARYGGTPPESGPD